MRRERLKMSTDVDNTLWKKQEKELAKELIGGKQVKGSGCSRRASRKADVITDSMLIEAKSTTKDSMTIKSAWLSKIKAEAFPNRTPCLSLHFKNKNTLVKWMALEQDVLIKLYNDAKLSSNSNMRNKKAIELINSMLNSCSCVSKTHHGFCDGYGCGSLRNVLDLLVND